MWTCPHCKESLEDNFGSCWNCGTDREGSPPENPELFEPENTGAYLSGLSLPHQCLRCGSPCVITGSLHRIHRAHFTPEDLRTAVFNLSFSSPHIEVSDASYSCLNCGLLWSQIDPREALEKIDKWGTKDINERIASLLGEAKTLLRASDETDNSVEELLHPLTSAHQTAPEQLLRPGAHTQATESPEEQAHVERD